MKRFIVIPILFFCLTGFSQGRFPFSNSAHLVVAAGGEPSHWTTDKVAQYIATSDYIVNTGTDVDTIKDASGNNHHLIPPTQVAEPVWDGDSLYFNGISHYAVDTFTLNQPTIVYAVLRGYIWTDNDTYWDGVTVASGRLREDNQSPEVYSYAGATIGPASIPLGSVVVVRVEFNGASSSIAINDGTPATGDAGSDTMDGLSLGARADANQYNDFRLYELVILDATETSGEEDSSWSYLNTKYSVY